MDFLTLEMIKQQCRVEDYSKDPERQRKIDNTLIYCGEKGEEAVYKYIGKNYAEIIKEYKEVPPPIKHAALIATYEMTLNERSPEEHYAFKSILNPYRKIKPIVEDWLQ